MYQIQSRENYLATMHIHMEFHTKPGLFLPISV